MGWGGEDMLSWTTRSWCCWLIAIMGFSGQSQRFNYEEVQDMQDDDAWKEEKHSWVILFPEHKEEQRWIFILPLHSVAGQALLTKLRAERLSEPSGLWCIHNRTGSLKKDVLFDRQFPAYGNLRSPCCSLMSEVCYQVSARKYKLVFSVL